MKIWLADMPECFGYGLCVLSHSEDDARRRLKNEYKAMRRAYGYNKPFDEAMEYFGGSVREIEPGKVYNDGFKL